MGKTTLSAALLAAIVMQVPATSDARPGRGRPQRQQPVELFSQTLAGEGELDQSLGDRDIDVCLQTAVDDAKDQYDLFAHDCRGAGGAPTLTPAVLTTNLVSFNEVTLLCTIEAQASCQSACRAPKHAKKQ